MVRFLNPASSPRDSGPSTAMLSKHALTMDQYKDRTAYDPRSSNNKLISTVTSYFPTRLDKVIVKLLDSLTP